MQLKRGRKKKQVLGEKIDIIYRYDTQKILVKQQKIINEFSSVKWPDKSTTCKNE